MKKQNKPISKCCRAEVKISSGIEDFAGKKDKGQTNYYVCSKCGKACDVIKERKMKRQIKIRELGVGWAVLVKRKLWKSDGSIRIFKTKTDADYLYPEYKKIKVKIIEEQNEKTK